MNKISSRVRKSEQSESDGSQDDSSDDDQDILDEKLRTIYIFGYLSEKQSLLIFRYLSKLENLYAEKKIREKMVTIFINSGGGDAFVGLSMNNRIRSSKIPVTTVGTGEVSSAAISVYLAGQRRLLHEDALIGFHRTEPESGMGSRDEAEKDSSLLKKVDSRARRIILANSNLNIQQLVEMEKERRYITAVEARKYGLAHEIIKNP